MTTTEPIKSIQNDFSTQLSAATTNSSVHKTLATASTAATSIISSTPITTTTATTTTTTTTTTATTTTTKATRSSTNNAKKSPMTLKLLPKNAFIVAPSPLRPLMPIALCMISFATVLSILIIYMDTTEIRHQQFRLNMSRDYDLLGVSQEDPTLLTYIREIHMKKYPLNFLKNSPIEHLNFTQSHELVSKMAKWQSALVDFKSNGTFVQSMTYAAGSLLTGPWLTETLNWNGVIIEPEPRRYFSLEKQNVHRSNIQVVHACLSPTGYPKEVTLPQTDDTEVRINSLLEEETWFNSRVKCFPLYTVMLAVNHINIDLLSLGCQGQELQILETVPFNKVNITIITLHLQDYNNIEISMKEYINKITRFLKEKSFKLIKEIDSNYLFKFIKK